MSVKFQIFQDTAKEYCFRLKAPNGEMIAVSEGYTTKQNARVGIRAVIKHAGTATVEDLT